tara:strand:+ start:1411 stop:2187 length:777 start_codon:yes stop_codon:yes gene_type:complete
MAIITGTGFKSPAVTQTHCANFDGSNDYIQITDNASGRSFFNSNENGTMSIWTKPETAETAVMFSIDDDDGWHHNKYIYTDSTGIGARVIGGGQICSMKYTAPYTGAWHHIVLTWHHSLSGTAGSGTSRAYLYIDGFLRCDSGNVSLTTISNDSDNGNIGKYHIHDDSGSGIGTGDHYYDGLICEVSTWNTYFTEGAVESVYNRGVPIDLTSNTRDYTVANKLTSWYRLQNNANDSSGKGYNGTNNGATFQTTNLPGA